MKKFGSFLNLNSSITKTIQNSVLNEWQGGYICKFALVKPCNQVKVNDTFSYKTQHFYTKHKIQSFCQLCLANAHRQMSHKIDPPIVMVTFLICKGNGYETKHFSPTTCE